MNIQKHQLQFLSFEEQIRLLKSSKYIDFLIDEVIGYKSDLYLVREGFYMEAVYSLTELPDELAFLSEVDDERLKEFKIF